jgi:hypothetical protein
MAVSMR